MCFWLFIDINEYYDQEIEGKVSKQEYDKLNLMALSLKDLLNKLLDKRKIAKRNINVEVSLTFILLLSRHLFIHSFRFSF